MSMLGNLMDKVFGTADDGDKNADEVKAELERDLAEARAERAERNAEKEKARLEEIAKAQEEAAAAQRAAEEAQKAAADAAAKAREAAARAQKEADQAAAEAKAAQAPAAVPVSAPSASPTAPAPKINLTASLDAQQTAHPEDLDWRRSIVDLMKLVDIDSSYGARKELALEMGYSQADIDSKGSAEMNMWLHKQVMQQLAQNGGDIPDDLLA